MDWTKCCVCQEDKKGDNLIDPSSINGPNASKDLLGMFAELIIEYKKKEVWPPDSQFDFVKLKMGNTGLLTDWLKANKAVYHGSCRTQFSSQKLTRLVNKESKKRKNPDQSPQHPIAKKKLRFQDTNTTHCESASKSDAKGLPCVFPFCNGPVLPDDPDRREVKTGTSDETGITKTLKNWAIIMDDSDLLSKIIITGGDLHAADVVYHRACYTKYFNKVKTQERKNSKTEKENVCASTQSIHHVIRHMAHSKETEGCFIFELDHMHSFYTQCLTDLDENESLPVMNKTRFKEKLLELAPHLESKTTSSRRVLFVYKHTIGDTLDAKKSESKESRYSEVISTVREYLLQPQPPFTGTFSEKCEENATTEQGLKFFKELLSGKAAAEEDSHCHRAALTLYQLAVLNCRARVSNSSNTRISHVKETPLSLHVTLKLHLHTQSKKLVPQIRIMHQL